jgi:hypothetical protein
VRMSPADSTRLGFDTAKDKLQGVHLGHFGAFLKREWRENDYLWGRLDAAERLIRLLQKDAGKAGVKLDDSLDWVKLALTTIVNEEAKTLGSIPEKIRKGVDGLWREKDKEIDLKTSPASPPTSWRREEMYDDEGR